MPVDIIKYYIPDTSLLSGKGIDGWNEMKPKSHLQIQTQIPIEVNPDSIYKTIDWTEKKFNKLFFAKNLVATLSHRSKHKYHR